eukprot:scaffold9976_cov121-Isochrysis_galbana.AAC.4
MSWWGRGVGFVLAGLASAKPATVPLLRERDYRDPSINTLCHVPEVADRWAGMKREQQEVVTGTFPS